jgi:hypothetical protein
MKRTRVLAAATIGLALCATWTLRREVVLAQSQGNVQVPKFQYDPTFPQPLPEKWAIGAIGGMAVDSHDHIWCCIGQGRCRRTSVSPARA